MTLKLSLVHKTITYTFTGLWANFYGLYLLFSNLMLQDLEFDMYWFNRPGYTLDTIENYNFK